MKRVIHTTLDINLVLWLEHEAKTHKVPMNVIITDAIVFYQQNRHIPMKLQSAKLLLNQIIREELLKIEKEKDRKSVMHRYRWY